MRTRKLMQNPLDILAHRKLFQVSRLQPKKRKRVLKPLAVLYPTATERWYERSLWELVNKLESIVVADIVPALTPAIAEAGITPLRSDSWVDTITLKVRRSKELFLSASLPFGDIARIAAQRVSLWNHDQFQKSMKHSLGATFSGKGQFAGINDDLIKSFVAQNVSLVNNISESVSNDLQQIIFTGIKQGRTAEQIARSIARGTDLDPGMFRKVYNRASLIATDQIGKLNGQITKERQTGLGLTRYRWRTAMDERVRDQHAPREGKVFQWASPPEGGHPGEAPRCRCYAEPMFEDIVGQGIDL
jgi:SPP1 gp7 family putative phage head morphogenesis protein